MMVPHDVTPDDEIRPATTILVVEDEILIRMATSEYLRDCGYRVLEAGHASEAQILVTSGEPIDIIFSDITMPGEMNGQGLAIWAQQHNPDIGIILTTGGSNKSIDPAKFTPGTVFFPKPYTLAFLESQIKKLLDDY